MIPLGLVTSRNVITSAMMTDKRKESILYPLSEMRDIVSNLPW